MWKADGDKEYDRAWTKSPRGDQQSGARYERSGRWRRAGLTIHSTSAPGHETGLDTPIKGPLPVNQPERVARTREGLGGDEWDGDM